MTGTNLLRRLVALGVLAVISNVELGTQDGEAASKRGSMFTKGATLAFAAFLGLLALVRSRPTLNLDVSATLRLQSQQHPVFTRVMDVVSWMGFRPQSLILPALIVAFMVVRGKGREAMFLILAWGASLISFTTKMLVRRPRPSGNGIVVTEAKIRDSSFPSGHVLHYVVFWGSVTYLIFTRLTFAPLRWLLVTVLTSLIVLVGPSRVYLGHHWLTDVLGSYTLGSGLLLTLISFLRRGDT